MLDVVDFRCCSDSMLRPIVGFSPYPPPSFLYPGSVRLLRLALPSLLVSLVSHLIYPPRRRFFSLQHRRCFHTTFPYPSRQTFMTGHAIYWGFKRISWRRRLVVPAPHFYHQMQFIPKPSQFELYTLKWGPMARSRGSLCAHGIFGFVLWPFIIPMNVYMVAASPSHES